MNQSPAAVTEVPVLVIDVVEDTVAPYAADSLWVKGLGLGFRGWGFGFRGWGLGFRV